MLIKNATIEQVNTAVITRFAQAIGQSIVQMPDLATPIPSTSAFNTYGWWDSVPGMREWIGERVVNNIRENAYQLLNRFYEFTLGALREHIDDSNLGNLTIALNFVTEAIRTWKDDILFSAWQAGTSQVTFDAVPYFSTTHPLSGSNQSNLFTSTPLTAANLNTVMTAMSVIVGANGKMINTGGRWTLIVPPALRLTAQSIVGAPLIVSGGAAVTNMQAGIADLKVIERLNNEPTVWYLARVGGPINPLILQVRQEAQIDQMTQRTSEANFWRRQLVWGADARGAAGYGPWWLAARAAA